METLLWWLGVAVYLIAAGAFFENWKYDHHSELINFEGFFYAMFWPISALFGIGRWLFKLVF